MFKSMLSYIILVILYIYIQKKDLYNFVISEDFENNVNYLLKLCLMIFTFTYYSMIKYSGAWSAIDMTVYLSGIGY